MRLPGGGFNATEESIMANRIPIIILVVVVAFIVGRMFYRRRR